MAASLQIRQVKSANGASRKQHETLKTLGLGRIGKATERPDDPIVRGLVAKVAHLVVVADG